MRSKVMLIAALALTLAGCSVWDKVKDVAIGHVEDVSVEVSVLKGGTVIASYVCKKGADDKLVDCEPKQ